MSAVDEQAKLSMHSLEFDEPPPPCPQCDGTGWENPGITCGDCCGLGVDCVDWANAIAFQRMELARLRDTIQDVADLAEKWHRSDGAFMTQFRAALAARVAATPKDDTLELEHDWSTSHDDDVSWSSAAGSWRAATPDGDAPK